MSNAGMLQSINIWGAGSNAAPSDLPKSGGGQLPPCPPPPPFDMPESIKKVLSTLRRLKKSQLLSNVDDITISIQNKAVTIVA